VLQNSATALKEFKEITKTAAVTVNEKPILITGEIVKQEKERGKNGRENGSMGNNKREGGVCEGGTGKKRPGYAAEATWWARM